MHPHISLITLGTTDFNRSLAFYRDTLGWTTTAKENDPVAFFALNGCIFGLCGKQELAADAGVDAQGDGFPGFSLAHNLQSIDAVDALFAELKSKGVTIMKEPHKTDWGGYSGYFADPDGYLWEVAFNPYWNIDDDGTIALL
jgi:catechol 2,3-dioxygenase-like lactoylglutathione lyase family enzyme